MLNRIVAIIFFMYGVKNLLEDPSVWFFWLWIGFCVFVFFFPGSRSDADGFEGGGDWDD